MAITTRGWPGDGDNCQYAVKAPGEKKKKKKKEGVKR